MLARCSLCRGVSHNCRDFRLLPLHRENEVCHSEPVEGSSCSLGGARFFPSTAPPIRSTQGKLRTGPSINSGQACCGPQNDKMLAVSGCQPVHSHVQSVHSHVTCHVLTVAICQALGSAARCRSPKTSALQIWSALSLQSALSSPLPGRPQELWEEEDAAGMDGDEEHEIVASSRRGSGCLLSWTME